MRLISIEKMKNMRVLWEGEKKFLKKIKMYFLKTKKSSDVINKPRNL